MAAFAEFFGAILLIFGFFFRPATFLLTFTMFVAMLFHLSRLDPWGIVSGPMELMFVFAGLFLIGPGRYSIDEYFRKRKEVRRLEREKLGARH
jgi:putative oxidoreductase